MKIAENEKKIDSEVWSAIKKIFCKFKAKDGTESANYYCIETFQSGVRFLIKKNFLCLILLHDKEEEIFISGVLIFDFYIGKQKIS